MSHQLTSAPLLHSNTSVCSYTVHQVHVDMEDHREEEFVKERGASKPFQGRPSGAGCCGCCVVCRFPTCAPLLCSLMCPVPCAPSCALHLTLLYLHLPQALETCWAP